jgi:hypothetical protein
MRNRRRHQKAVSKNSNRKTDPIFEATETTIEDFLKYLAPAITSGEDAPAWPPDAFALVASLLQESGAYTKVISNWPPNGYKGSPQIWAKEIQVIGSKWRESAISNLRPPLSVNTWWRTVLARKNFPIARISSDPNLYESLLQLCAASDEACAGVGITGADSDEFERQAQLLLERTDPPGSTLCRGIRTSKIRVLPKLHTPQSGMTVRSLTHHLALCGSGDVEVIWRTLPYHPESLSLNLLLVPWPNVVTPSQFKAASGHLHNMPPSFGFFEYTAPNSLTRSRRVLKLFESAEKVVGRIDGVIFPELALSPQEHEGIKSTVLEKGAFLISGARESGSKANMPGQNYVVVDIPVGPFFVQFKQHKHHRWRLDRNQIVQYGLGGSLDPNCFWWEHIEIRNRQLRFAAMRQWLTLSALVCEDLSRQDPVAEIVRAVGPNLVIALLMDGPQLLSRWSARYATVLADDPGSSVLTLTSLGMAQLSRSLRDQAQSRVVALWKDAKSGEAIQIELPRDAEAIVLSLTVQYFEEWTADGRTDNSATGYPILSGIHPISVEKQSSL